MTTSPTLTPKQQQVFDLLEKGVPVAAVAKRLKISTSGVYGHIRNMRAAGVALPNGLAEPAPPPAPPVAPAPPEPAATANGLPDPSAALRAAITAGEDRLQTIAEEVDVLEAQLVALRTESDTIVSGTAKFTAALEQLK